MMPTQIDFASPPRITGNASADLASVVEFLWSFYRSAILSGGLIQNTQLVEQLQSQFARLYNLATLGAVVADTLPYFSGTDDWALTGLTPFARTILDDEDAAAVRTTIGAGDVSGPAGATAGNVAVFADATGKLISDGGALGTISTQDADNVNIDGGAIDDTTIGATTKTAGGFTNLTATGYVEVGTSPAQTGSLRIPNGTGNGIYARDAAGTADRQILYLSNGNVIVIPSGASCLGTFTVSNYIAGSEQAAPAAPAANGYRLFAQDNGAGKTQLMVIFNSGAAQQIAIQP